MSDHARNVPVQIEVEIEQLVLEGFDPRDRARIGAALERELGRLLGEGGVPGAWGAGGSVAHLDAGSFEMTPGGSAESVGASIAAALHGGVSR